MPVAAIKTEADTWVPTSEHIYEIIGKPVHILAEVNFNMRESGAKSRDEIAQLSAQQELCASILRAFGKYSKHGHGTVTIEFDTGHAGLKPALTEKQRRSIALVKKWMTEDRDEQTEAMRRFMEAIDEEREGYRTLYKNK